MNNLDEYQPMGLSHRQTKWGVLQRQCVQDFFHSNDSSSINSNSRKIYTINGEKHVGRVWLAKIINEKYQIFIVSEVLDVIKNQEPQFPVPSKFFFYHNRCRYVSSPVLQSCVEIPMNRRIHYMRAIDKFICRPDIKARL